MRNHSKLRLIASLILISSFVLPAAQADSTVTYLGGRFFALTITDDAGNEFTVTGSPDLIQNRMESIQSEFLALTAQITLGDSCRTQVCFKQEVNATTGETQLIALTEAEILARELEVAKRATRLQAILDSAGANYMTKAESIYAIPISAGGISQTIQGTPAQIASEVQRLRNDAELLKANTSVDPCAVETCYKTIVDLHWGLAPATTTTIPLTQEDLAQRAIDRNQAATRAEAVAAAAESGTAAPVYSFNFQTPNSSFGTSGTRDQLAATVAQLQERAAQAAANASNLANNPIVERNVIVDLHWGLAPATTTIEERTITGEERDARIAAANSEAASAQALADAASQALASIE